MRRIGMRRAGISRAGRKRTGTVPMVALVVVMVAAGAAVAGQWPELRRYLKMKRM